MIIISYLFFSNITNSISDEFITYSIIIMSRGNVFKLSSNNVLGSGGDYHNSDIEEIKNSLKLLKSKKNQRQSSETQGYNYNGLPNQGSSIKSI